MQLGADAILLLHLAFITFVVGGLIFTWFGAILRWNWIRNIWFRVAHLAAICFVAVEALLGVMCPLTVWEDALRGHQIQSSFIARWVHRVIFYELPESVFTAIYVVFMLVVLVTYWLVPPHPPRVRKVR